MSKTEPETWKERTNRQEPEGSGEEIKGIVGKIGEGGSQGTRTEGSQAWAWGEGIDCGSGGGWGRGE